MIKLKPKKMVNPFPTRHEWIIAIKEGLYNTANKTITVLKKTTKTWKDEPFFSIQPGSNQYEVVVGTGHEVWNMLNVGTEPHIIRPRKPNGRLWFKVGGRAKTKINTLNSYAGAPGKTQAVAVEVHHPGTAPRKWTQAAAREMRPILRDDVQKSINKALAKRRKK